MRSPSKFTSSFTPNLWSFGAKGRTSRPLPWLGVGTSVGGQLSHFIHGRSTHALNLAGIGFSTYSLPYSEHACIGTEPPSVCVGRTIGGRPVCLLSKCAA